MGPNIENPFINNPNFLVLTIDERLKQSRDMTNRAGVMISVEALLATFIFILHQNETLSWGLKFYFVILPLAFIAISFFLHLSTFFRGNILYPFEYLVFLAQQERLEPPQAQDSDSELKVGLDEINKSFSKKLNSMNYGYSFFSISFILLIIVNLASPTFLIEKLHTDGVVAFSTLLIAIISAFIAIIFKLVFFVPKVRKLSLNIRKTSQMPQLQLTLEPVQPNMQTQPFATTAITPTQGSQPTPPVSPQEPPTQ